MFRYLKLIYPVLVLLCVLTAVSAYAETPVCTITYGKTAYAPGETVAAHYEIDFDGAYAAVYVEWGIIDDWATGEIQSSDGFMELTSLSGDISYTPADCEGVAPFFTLIEIGGGMHSIWGEPVQITGESASEPVCTLEFDKSAYASGETITLNYSIDFSGSYSALYAEWAIITDWETGAVEPADGYSELTALAGEVSFAPESGEGIIVYLTLIETGGKWHSFESEPVQITGGSAAAPVFAAEFDKDIYEAGETVTASYSIDFDWEYASLYAEWGVVTDRESGEVEPVDGYTELTALTGEVAFESARGEGVILYLTLIETGGKWHSFESEPVQVSAAAAAPVCTVVFDKEAYTLGDTVTAGYSIAFEGEYTEIYAEWGVVTDWDAQDIQSGGSAQELTALEGEISFTPAYGEGAVVYITLIEANGKWHTMSAAPVRIYSSGVTFLPGDLQIIEAEAFAGAKFTRVVCPESLVSIGNRAFAECADMQMITIPASVRTIAADAFAGCSALTTFIVEEGSAAEEFAAGQGYVIIYK